VLTGLSIRNVVLIESLDLEFGPGLTALTGETGAGKSIILDALSMATGARSDRGLLRKNTEKAQVAASFELLSTHPVWEFLDEHAVEFDKMEALTLRRQISADGRSRAFVNDAPVSVKLLSSIGTFLLEIHGQHDGRGLLDPATHIDLLDAYGGHSDMRSLCDRSFKAKRIAEDRLVDLLSAQEKNLKEREFVEHAIEELDRLAPAGGEEEKLAGERRFLQGAEGALGELTAAQSALGEDGAFEERLSTALAGIDRVQSKFSDMAADIASPLSEAASALERALLETQEARSAVNAAALQFDVDPDRLNDVEKRLFALRAAARKYDCGIDELIAMRSQFAEKLSGIENAESDISKARADVEQAGSAFEKISTHLSKARKKAAVALNKSIMKELPPLKMENAKFFTEVEPTEPSALGTDRVRFQVSTNPGTSLGALDKIASGGELARVSLAIKVSLAGKNNAAMVFDEVDQGVGGAVADAVGKRLARLASAGQVFVVTHSPQVAACAHHQFRIEKSSQGKSTRTDVTLVADDAREEEIARMLAGETVTQEARAAARQLMAS